MMLLLQTKTKPRTKGIKTEELKLFLQMINILGSSFMKKHIIIIFCLILASASWMQNADLITQKINLENMAKHSIVLEI